MDNRQDGAADAADREAQAREPNPPVKTSADMSAGDKSPGSAANAATMNDGANGGLMDESDAVLEERADLGIVDPDAGGQRGSLSDGNEAAATDAAEDGNSPLDGAVATNPMDQSPARPLGGTNEAALAGPSAREIAEAEAANREMPSGLTAVGHQVGATIEISHAEAMRYLRSITVDRMGRIWRMDPEDGKLQVTMIGTLNS